MKGIAAPKLRTTALKQGDPVEADGFLKSPGDTALRTFSLQVTNGKNQGERRLSKS